MTAIKKIVLLLPAVAIALGLLVVSSPSANAWAHHHRRWHRHHHHWHRR